MYNIKRFLAQNKYFWKYRHLIPNFLDSRKGKSKIVNKKLIELIIKNSYKSFFDFGFGKGELLLEIYENIKYHSIYGIDINKKNVFDLKKKINGSNIFLQTEFNKDLILKKMATLGQKQIDLFIFDRVLYILSDKELEKLLLFFDKAQNIFIDDFVKINLLKKTDYKHRDWIKILKCYNFKIKENLNSINGQPHGCYSRSLLFSKIE